ncbi:MAG: molybdenum cofactor guanylyltransferase MobA [Acidiferrobacterales bacterium]
MKNDLFHPREITGVVLAGGRSSRMGGTDKGLVEFRGKAMAQHVIEALQPEVSTLLINANRNSDKYSALGFPVVADLFEGYLGPLAGMASGMSAASTPYIVTAPCDCPLVGTGLVKRLYQAVTEENAQIGVAHDGERPHPVFALIQRDLLTDLLGFLESGERKIDRWYARHRLAVVKFDDVPEWFQNVNSPEEHAELEVATLWK